MGSTVHFIVLLSREEFQHLRVQFAVAAGEHVTALVARSARPIGDRAAGRLDQRDQRLHIVRLQAGLDDDVDESHRELRVAIAVAAEARQARGTRRSRRRPRVAAGDWKWRGSVVATIASSMRAHAARAQRAPLVAAPPLREAALRCRGTSRPRTAGARRRPPDRSPSCSAISVAQCSWPRMKLRVPSIGSMTQVKRRRAGLLAVLLAVDAMVRDSAR